MAPTQTFLPQKGNYKSLIIYQKAECIYDITYHFAHRFFERGDRTIDQMVQAARSGKQTADLTGVNYNKDVYLNFVYKNNQDSLQILTTPY